jgi:perosamine synthetase
MALTDDDALQARISVLRDHGRQPGDTAFYNREVAFKYKMSALQAAFGCAQIERVDELVTRKREIFGWYAARLGAVDGLTLNAQPADVVNSYWMVTAVVDGVGKDDLAAALARDGIATRPFFHPLSDLPAYADLPTAKEARERNVVAHRLAPHGINLPSALCLDEATVDRVCAAVLRSVSALR